MRPSPKTYVKVLSTQATAGQTNTAYVDVSGYDYAVINLALLGIETSATPTQLHLQEADLTNATYFADVTGAVGGTSFTIPATINTLGQDPSIVQMRVDLRNRKRYLQMSVAAATKTLEVMAVDLFLPEQSPEDATSANVTTLVVI